MRNRPGGARKPTTNSTQEFTLNLVFIYFSYHTPEPSAVELKKYVQIYFHDFASVTNEATRRASVMSASAAKPEELL